MLCVNDNILASPLSPLELEQLATLDHMGAMQDVDFSGLVESLVAPDGTTQPPSDNGTLSIPYNEYHELIDQSIPWMRDTYDLGQP
jgi:hypothetical protein